MQLTPIGEPRLSVLRALFAKLCGCGEQVMHPAMREAPLKPREGPQQLGPNQLKWLEERFQFYGIHRRQAEAPTGVAVVRPTQGER